MPVSQRPGESLLDKYKIVKQLYKADIGNTTVSIVQRTDSSSQVSNPSEQFILKDIDLSYLGNPEYIQQSRTEFRIQSELQHEHIVRCIEFEERDNHIRAILEIVNKPEYLQIELDDNMEAISNEYILKTFMFELLEAVAYIHSKGIIHCDIKVENILGQHTEGQSFPSLKICDFGLARKVDPATQSVFIEKKMGTKEYLAPEVKDQATITSKVDIFCLGLVFYKMCTTYLPSQLSRDWISKGATVPFREADWAERPNFKVLQGLIESMLRIDPSQRPSAEELLGHPYFSIDEEEEL